RDVRLFGIQLAEGVDQHALLLRHRDAVEARDLVLRGLEPLHALAVLTGAIEEMTVEAQLRIEPGVLPLERLERQRQRPWLEALQRLDGQAQRFGTPADARERVARYDGVQRLTGRQHAPRQHRQLGLRRQ